MKTIFGPVHSRRFGASLGIDLSPNKKQCNFDCLYCELSAAQTLQHQDETVEVTTIITELQEALSIHKEIDVLTFTANGEPSIYPHLNSLLDEIDKLALTCKTLILTNSATLDNAQTFKTLQRFDKVKLSLDAVSPDIFKKIDRPHESINLDALVKALIDFSKIYTGELFIEILFVQNLNDTAEEIQKLNKVLLELKGIARIDIGTIDRPPAYPVMGLSYKELFTISKQFDTSLPIHIASRQHAELNHSYYSTEEIINTLDKRPLTKADIDLLFDTESQKNLEKLLQSGNILIKEVSNIAFYLPKKNYQRKRKNS